MFPSLWLLYGGSIWGRELFGFVYEFSDYVGLKKNKANDWSMSKWVYKCLIHITDKQLMKVAKKVDSETGLPRTESLLLSKLFNLSLSALLWNSAMNNSTNNRITHVIKQLRGLCVWVNAFGMAKDAFEGAKTFISPRM